MRRITWRCNVRSSLSAPIGLRYSGRMYAIHRSRSVAATASPTLRCRVTTVAATLIFVLGAWGHVRAETCGDADGSGSVTVTDGVTVLRAAANLPSTCSMVVCDVDGSGTITVTDGVNVLRGAAGLPMTCRDTLGACGRAGRVCPAGEHCVDIPNDDCDPGQGDPDCPGICERESSAQCAEDVDCPAPGAPCMLCPDGSAACPLTFCDRATHQCRLVFQVCPATACGGIAGALCPFGQQCIDDPRDGCDPDRGGADCDGLCVG